MPRAPRDLEAGVFHVTAHSVRSEDLFRDEIDRANFVAELERAARAAGWRCLAFCLMTTHFHLIVDVPRDSLARGMHALNFRYASQFNARHGTRGHVFERRYGSRRIGDREYLLTAFRYVSRNPVTARLCTAPEDWPWSSYGAVIGQRRAPTFVDARDVVAEFGALPELAVAGLRAFVEET